LARAGARWRALVHAAFARGADAALVRAGLGRGEGWESEGDWAWGRGGGGLGRADGEGREGESGGGGGGPAAAAVEALRRGAPSSARTHALLIDSDGYRTAHACTGV
jgi:hypothetical protein